MTKSEEVLKALRAGATLRFIDYGSGAQRVCYFQLVIDGIPEPAQSPQVFYRLRKRGLIVPSGHHHVAFDYYKLAPDAPQEAS